MKHIFSIDLLESSKIQLYYIEDEISAKEKNG